VQLSGAGTTSNDTQERHAGTTGDKAVNHRFATPSRRQLLGLGAASLAALTPAARAQTGQPLKIMVGFAAGGSADQTARLLADQLRVQLKRPVIVDNRAGAGGRIMVEGVKAAKPDGDTLMFVPHGAMTLFPHIYRSLRYDPVADFTPIGRVCNFDFALSTGPATNARTMAEYLAWARDPAHKPAFGSPGPGTVPHFIGQGVAERAKLPLVHVPYRGAAPSVVDVIGGAISMAIMPLADVVEHHKAGKLHVLATSGSKPTTVLGGIPTLKDAGIDLVVDGWYGLYAPAGLPAATQQQLAAALQAAVPAMAPAMARNALTPAASTPQELAQLQKTESAFWAQLVKSSGFKPED